MNYAAITIHWVSMFLALAGGIMLSVWLFKNLKSSSLLTVIVIAIILGLVGAYLTFPEEVEFMTEVLGK